MGEGDWYLQEDPDFLLNSGESLTGDYRDYLHFYVDQSRQRVAEDAALMISWDELGRRIGRWERFGAAHPSLPETGTVLEPEIRKMMTWYLLGLDNTRAYDFSKKGAIDPKLLESYGAFLERNSESRYSPLISRIYESLRASEGRMSSQLLDLLKGAGYRNWWLEREAEKLLATPGK